MLFVIEYLYVDVGTVVVMKDKPFARKYDVDENKPVASENRSTGSNQWWGLRLVRATMDGIVIHFLRQKLHLMFSASFSIKTCFR